MTGGLKMGVNVAAHTRHIFLGSTVLKYFKFFQDKVTVVYAVRS